METLITDFNVGLSRLWASANEDWLYAAESSNSIVQMMSILLMSLPDKLLWIEFIFSNQSLLTLAGGVALLMLLEIFKNAEMVLFPFPC